MPNAPVAFTGSGFAVASAPGAASVRVWPADYVTVTGAHGRGDRRRRVLKLPTLYAGSLNPCRASSFQLPSCFCQTWRAPILVVVALPSSSDSPR